MNRKNLIIIISILAFILIIGGVSYSYFVYNKDIGTVSLTAGDISIDLSGVNGNQTLSNVVPLSDFDGKNSSSYFDFTVNSTVDTERIYYEVYIMPDSNNTLDTSYLKTYLTDQNNNEIKGTIIYDNLGPSEVENGKVIYRGIIELNNNQTTKNESKDFRLRLWLDESYNEPTSKTFAFDIYLYAKNVDSDYIFPRGDKLLRKGLESKTMAGGSCGIIIMTDADVGIDYLSGTNECIDMNYVWYSGKLWQITAIYFDGSMKMVTDKPITTIQWGDTSEFNGSWIYQWLNEDFYDTLNSPDYIIKTGTWNYSTLPNIRTDPVTIATQKTINAKVGLLNGYEYYNGFCCIADEGCTGMNYEDNFIAGGYNSWLISPYDSTRVFDFQFSGIFTYNVTTMTFGVQPSIILKPGVEFTGAGSITNPYRIVGDKPSPINNTTLLNSRSSGEYLRFNNELYRIVETNEDGTTKIVKDDYVKSSDTALLKTPSSSSYFGKSSNTQSNDYWDYYLNNTWYNGLNSTYKNMLVNSTYYLGTIADVSHYKNTICKDADLNTVTVKNCTRYTSSDTNKTVSIKVGLSRAGEMFASPISDSTSAVNAWSITPYDATHMRFFSTNGQLRGDTLDKTYAVRPTLTLKSGIKITNGNGYSNSPFEISA